MTELQGKQTENLLRNAVSGEAQAALLYDFFAKKARVEGFEEIADIFEETAINEKAHAKIYLNLLKCIRSTGENLEAAAETEHHEAFVMYPEFAAAARAEGLEEVAKTFEMIGKIEARHEERFRYYEKSLKNGSLFSKGMETEWICKNCGHWLTSTNAPELCPVCKHPVGYFETVKKST